MGARPDSSSTSRFSSNQSRFNPPPPEVKLENTMANDPRPIWYPESSEGEQVSTLPPKSSPQTSPPAELPRTSSLFSMLLQSNDESPLVMNVGGSHMDVPVDRTTGMYEAQMRRQRNAEASARSRKKRGRKEGDVHEETKDIRSGAEKIRRKFVETIKEKDEKTEILRRESAKKLEDEELENKRSTTLLQDEAAPGETNYAPDATLLGATYDPTFNPFLTPDYYLTADNYAADPTELYWDCIESLYTQYE
ncbi:hypothetical protein E4U59_004133 [Claviceps monticola]|nr:hypothetical protein E4U59_004133 [Claviceps monticola]